MKKFSFTGMFFCILLLTFAGCAKKSEGIIIGISKIQQHNALDACELGIQDALTERGIKATYDLQNANGDMSTVKQIADKFKSEHVNVAVGIATPTAQALVNSIKNIPVVFTAVVDPVGAGLVKSEANGEGNVTGASDRIPTEDNIILFKDIAGIKRLGFIYTPSESNSITELKIITRVAAENGIELVTQTVNTSADVKQAAESIIQRIDGLYMSTDNTVVSALSAIVNVFKTAKKPVFSGDASGALVGGCMIAKGYNYYKLGLATGNIVADILGGKSPADIPVRFVTDPSELDFLIDLDAAKNCGITIPQSYIDQATMIFENGVLTEK
ncbi:MAG: ABC transporter substrate-binding protein [Spirochaetaceae bacterium]|nr:ABC transporter substrate-binding protein [Spirochaetaceae bacterium]